MGAPRPSRARRSEGLGVRAGHRGRLLPVQGQAGGGDHRRHHRHSERTRPAVVQVARRPRDRPPPASHGRSSPGRRLRGVRRQGRATGGGVRGIAGGRAGRLEPDQRRVGDPIGEAAPRQAGDKPAGSSGPRLDLTYRAKSRTDSHSSSLRSPISVSLASWRSSMGLSYSCLEM